VKRLDSIKDIRPSTKPAVAMPVGWPTSASCFLPTTPRATAIRDVTIATAPMPGIHMIIRDSIPKINAATAIKNLLCDGKLILQFIIHNSTENVKKNKCRWRLNCAAIEILKLVNIVISGYCHSERKRRILFLHCLKDSSLALRMTEGFALRMTKARNDSNMHITIYRNGFKGRNRGTPQMDAKKYYIKNQKFAIDKLTLLIYNVFCC